MVEIADIRKAVAALAPRYGVSRAVLFGSYARGEQTPSSDVDLVLNLSRPLGFKRAELTDLLEKRIGLPVDVVFGEEQLYEPVRKEYERDRRVVYESGE